MTMFRSLPLMTFVVIGTSHLIAANPDCKTVTVLSDLQYDTEANPAANCGVYARTVQPPPSGHPVVILVHGDAWVSGDKSHVEKYARAHVSHADPVTLIIHGDLAVLVPASASERFSNTQ